LFVDGSRGVRTAPPAPPSGPHRAAPSTHPGDTLAAVLAGRIPVKPRSSFRGCPSFFRAQPGIRCGTSMY